MPDYYDLAKEDRKVIDEALGTYNYAPPDFEMITESEYLWIEDISPAGRVYQQRQVTKPPLIKDGRGYETVNLVIFPDLSGIGRIIKYDGKATRAEVDAFHQEYFKWQWCKHEYETTHKSMHYWEGTCKLCGYKDAIDSSG